MTSFDPPDDNPSTSEEFADTLTTLIRAADREDIGICGGYRIECESDERAFGVEIYRVVPRDD